jgi:iron complex outermembrane receptor protein
MLLQDGVRNGSLGFQSGDHGEPVDTLNLERVEIIKGPATLLYGSSAIGGVINAITGDEDHAHPGFRGSFTALGGTNNRQAGIAGGIEYGYKNFLLNVNGNTMKDGDFSTPLGRIPNSSSRSHGGTGSAGYYGEKGFFAGYVSLDRRRYGVPYTPLFESGELLSIANGGIDCDMAPPPGCQFNVAAIRDAFADTLPPAPDEAVDLKMRRNNFRFRGGFRDVKGPISQGNFFVDFSDYQHQEIESEPGLPEEVATTFDNDVFSYRAVFQQANYQRLSGRFGVEGFRRSYLTSGAEQLIDGRVRQTNISVFGLEELSFDRVALQFGGRVENNKYRPTNTAAYDSRDFTEFSGAAAARFRLWEGGSFVANFTTSSRTPTLEELYNFGPHVGTVTFEVGDQDLQTERSNGVEFSLRQQTNRLRVNGSVFYYNISNFIFLEPQDEDGDGNIDVDDGLPVGAYVQNDARFLGADFTLDYELNKYFAPFFIADVVSARLQQSNTPLPRITPARVRMGLDIRFKGLSVRPEGVFAFNKSAVDVFPLETPTRGYGFFNANASYTYAHGKIAHIFTVSAQNLNDKLYRNHSNFIKDLMPEAGRGVRASYTIRFL